MHPSNPCFCCDCSTEPRSASPLKRYNIDKLYRIDKIYTFTYSPCSDVTPWTGLLHAIHCLSDWLPRFEFVWNQRYNTWDQASNVRQRASTQQREVCWHGGAFNALTNECLMSITVLFCMLVWPRLKRNWTFWRRVLHGSATYDRAAVLRDNVAWFNAS